MDWIEERPSLTHKGALAMMTAAVAKAEEIGAPQCIVIVDASGELLAEVRMTGAKFLSRKSARAKALTAASMGAASSAVPDYMRPEIALATGGAVTWLQGGLPIKKDGRLVGGIGVGSGKSDQDLIVGRAGLAAIGADPVG